MNATIDDNTVTGSFVTLDAERYYVSNDFDRMAPFFVNLVSDCDLWMFVASNGGLTAGRVSPETALFPYITVDKVHESTAHTGSKTILRVTAGGQLQDWEPFNREHDDRFSLSRNRLINYMLMAGRAS